MARRTTHAGSLLIALSLLSVGCANAPAQLDEAVYDNDELEAELANERADGVKPTASTGRLDTFLPNGSYPDTGTWDSVGRKFFVGSLSTGNVYVTTPRGLTRTLYLNTESGRMTLGMAVDTERRLLHVCSVNKKITEGSLLTFELSELDANPERELIPTSIQHLSSLATGATCNDITLDRAGNVYTVDRQNPRVFKMDSSTGNVSIFAQSSLLGSFLIGANSIAITDDGNTMLVGIYKPARLVAIDMTTPSLVRNVKLHGDSFGAGFDLLGGADGAVLYGSCLYVAMNKHIARLCPRSSAWLEADVVRRRREDGITSLLVADGDLYSTNGQSTRFALKLVEEAPFQIRKVDVTAF